MEHLENTVPFDVRRQHAKAFSLSGTGFQDWLVAFLQRIRGVPTVYDYAARVTLCQRLMENLNRNYQKACKMALEKVLFNLSPNPEQVVMAVQSQEAIRSTFELSPLNDDVAKGGDGLVQARYRILTDALKLYCEIGLEDIQMDIDETDLTEYRTWYEASVLEIPALQERLKEGRISLYLDFPEEELTSVSESTILRARTDLKKNEAISKSKQGKAVAEEIKTAQDQLLRLLREIIARARLTIESHEAKAEIFLSLVSNIKVLKHMLEAHIEPEEGKRMEDQLKAFEEHIRAFFSPSNYIPKEVLQDVTTQCQLFGNGNPKS